MSAAPGLVALSNNIRNSSGHGGGYYRAPKEPKDSWIKRFVAFFSRKGNK